MDAAAWLIISGTCWIKHVSLLSFKASATHSSASEQTFSVCSKIPFFTKHFGNGVLFPRCPQCFTNLSQQPFFMSWSHLLCSNLSGLFKYLPPLKKVNKSLEKHKEMLAKPATLLTSYTGAFNIYCHPELIVFFFFSVASRCMVAMDEEAFVNYTSMFLSNLVYKGRSKIPLWLMSINLSIYFLRSYFQFNLEGDYFFA